MSIQEEFEKVEALKLELVGLGISDPEVIHDTLEGQTSIFELLDWMLNKESEETFNQEAIKSRIESLSQRKKASEGRQHSIRGLIERTMGLIGEKKIKRPEATLTLSDKKPSITHIDEALLNEKFFVVKKEPSRTLINEAIKNGEAVEGVLMSNGGVTLTVRR